MTAIFISYRRGDSQGHANRLYDALCAHFGQQNVFMDVGSIGAGGEWQDKIRSALKDCKVMIAIIGRQWDAKRLASPNDYVRYEISQAFDCGVSIMPLMVDGASLPDRADLRAGSVQMETDRHRRSAPLEPVNPALNI